MSATSDADAQPDLAWLAEQACTWTRSSVPATVQAQARLCVLDTLGCIVAGTRTAEARTILACEPADGAKQATIYGTHEGRGLLAAAQINGYLGDVLELNDLIGGHASIGNVTAALALAEATDASADALLESVVRGIEVTSRVYDAVYPSLKRFAGMGIVPVGVPSAIGSAAAAARLLALSPEQTWHALAIAGTLAGWCPAEVIFGDGGTVKPLLFGAQPGTTGLRAALYAQHGLSGPPRLLESPLGYYATVSESGRLDRRVAASRWALAAPRRKLHACCGYLHSPLDAAVKLRSRLGVLPAAATLDVHVPPYTAEAVGKVQPPRSPNDARFHLAYCVALVLHGADTIEPAHSIELETRLAEPALVATLPRVRAVADPTLDHYHRCRLVLRDAQGQVLAEELADAPRGSPGRPLTDDEVLSKFLRLSSPVVGAARADQVARQVLEGLDPVRAWTARLVPNH